MKKVNLAYSLLVLFTILFLLIQYPRIYGVDAFEVMWMANALRNGALFSENTWLIHPASYFGMYPFSHRAIGVPMFLAFLISLLEFFSLGNFGLTEAILAFNIILILIIYKSSRNLGNRLFEEEWSRFLFVVAILLSPNVFSDIIMTVSTRIIITIVMIVLLNLNLKIIRRDNYKKFKITIFMFLLLLVGALAHRLWLITIITIILMIFTVFILKYEKLQKLTFFLILPMCIIAFFIGLDFFNVDARKIWSPFFDNSTLIGVNTNLTIHYALQAGLFLIFFPVGVIITLYKLTILLKKSDDDKNTQFNNKNQQFLRRNFYLLLFMVPFSFMAPDFYAVIIFLPILIIFSIYGMIYVKKFIISISKKLNWFFPMVILFLAVGYSFLYVQMILSINLWYMFVLFSIALFIYVVSFIIHKYNGKIKSKISFINFNNNKFRQGIEVLVLIFSIIIFSTTTIVGRWRTVSSSPYPWENHLYLTEEEQEIINFFQYENVTGLIYANVPEIANRISGVAFLPIFSGNPLIGFVLYYGFISPNEVHESTTFSLSGLYRFNLFTLNIYPLPIHSLLRIILRLNVSLEGDFNVLLSECNVQYIISIKDTFQSESINNWLLIQSLQQSELFEPVFSTSHLLIWKIY